eukprot:141623_1
MGGVFSRRKKPRLRCLLLGLDAAGKTTIVSHLKLGKASETVPTIGFNVETVKCRKLKINIWDVGGQDRLRPLWRHYYSGTSGIIFVVDSSDRARMEQAKEELHFLMDEQELEETVFLILANKQDMPGAIPPEEVAKLLEVDALPNAHTVMPSVAKTGEGIEEAMDWLLDNVRSI